MNRIHIGAYWIYVKENKILLIKKARGPYRWMYDLPGGGIEYGETIKDCLKREIHEETWAVLKTSSFLWKNEYICNYENLKNQSETSHHIGFYYYIKLSYSTIKSSPDGEDSLGAEFIDIFNLNNIQISPIAKPMILKALEWKLTSG